MIKTKNLLLLIGILALGSIGLVAAGLFRRDAIIESNQNIPQSRVSTPSVSQVSDLTITHLSELFDDGSLVFDVKRNGEPIGQFYFKPWVEKNPVSRQLTNGDVILGNNNIVSTLDGKMHPIGEGTSLGYVFDYAVGGNQLALIGKEDGGSISIYVKDLAGGNIKKVDSFSYPPEIHPETVYIAWGPNGTLFYDSWNNGKPAITAYDSISEQVSVYLDEAMNPQGSPDGTYLVVHHTDSVYGKQASFSALELLDSNKQVLTKLNGSRKMFWSPKHLTVWNTDQSTLEIHDLTKGGAVVKSVPMDSLPSEVEIGNNGIRIKGYKFTKTNEIIEVAQDSSM